MKICVLVKEVPDAAVTKRIDPSTGRLDRSGEKNLNPYDTHAIEAAHKAALAGETKYPPIDGIKPLKEAIQRKIKRDNHLDYALDEIMVSNGSKQIMYDALMASVNPGDEVIIPAPYWISYADQAS